MSGVMQGAEGVTCSGSRTTVVSVCFESAEILPTMLASIPEGVPVVLVDNGSTDVASIKAAADRAGARLVCNDANRGFGAACNQGAALASTEYVLFLNPDARLGPGCIAALEAAADGTRSAVAFNPAISAPGGQPSFKHRSVLLPRAAWLGRGQPDGDREVPVLSGAALFVRTSAFAAVGGFDENIFLYHEDDDLSLRLATGRGALRFVKAAEVRHAGGRSSVRSPEVAALKGWHMGRSRVYAARKHHRPWPFATALTVALAQLASPLALLSPRKRAKQLGFLRGIWSMRARVEPAVPRDSAAPGGLLDARPRDRARP
ncbi:MAG: glycosyltransferase family 2 protein [Rhodobacteraceae bacterium]|nr:glycosyltransferase family 2 protein [Paracoccaceae bacterium]